jgi:hypothetical protein
MRHPCRFTPAVLAVSALVMAVPMGGARAELSLRDTFGGIVMGAGALAVEAALAESDGEDGEIYVLDKGYIDPNKYVVADDPPYSPVKDIFCYAKQELCLGPDGAIAREWTHTIYNR